MTQQFDLMMNTSTMQSTDSLCNYTAKNDKSFDNSNSKFGDIFENVNKNYDNNSSVQSQTEKRETYVQYDNRKENKNNNNDLKNDKNSGKTEQSIDKKSDLSAKNEVNDVKEEKNKEIGNSDAKKDLNETAKNDDKNEKKVDVADVATNVVQDKTIVDENVNLTKIIPNLVNVDEKSLNKEKNDVKNEENEGVSDEVAVNDNEQLSNVARLEKNLKMEFKAVNSDAKVVNENNDLTTDAIKSGLYKPESAKVNEKMMKVNNDNVLQNTELNMPADAYISGLYKSDLKIANENTEKIDMSQVNAKALKNTEKAVVIEKEPKSKENVAKTDEKTVVTKDEKTVKAEDIKANAILNNLSEKDKTIETDAVSEGFKTNSEEETLVNSQKTSIEENALISEKLNLANNTVELKKDLENSTEETLTEESSAVSKTDKEIDTNKEKIKNLKEDSEIKSMKEDDLTVEENFAEIDEALEISESVKDLTKDLTKDLIDSDLSEDVLDIKFAEDATVKVSLNKDLTQEKDMKMKETLSKAGLTSDNMKEMNVEITKLDASSNQSDMLNQNAQEQLIRASIQQTGESAKTGTFAQAMSKLNQADTLLQPQKEIKDVDIISQINAKMQASKADGTQKITLSLTPESLGKISLEITSNKDGITAKILAENNQAKEMLDKNIDGLKSMLQSQGVNVNNVSVKVSESQKSDGFFNDTSSQFGEQKNQSDNSNNSNETNKQKQSEFDFMNKALLNEETETDEENTLLSTVSTEKTVSLNSGSGLGKVSYKL